MPRKRMRIGARAGGDRDNGAAREEAAHIGLGTGVGGGVAEGRHHHCPVGQVACRSTPSACPWILAESPGPFAWLAF